MNVVDVLGVTHPRFFRLVGFVHLDYISERNTGSSLMSHVKIELAVVMWGKEGEDG